MQQGSYSLLCETPSGGYVVLGPLAAANDVEAIIMAADVVTKRSEEIASGSLISIMTPAGELVGEPCDVQDCIRRAAARRQPPQED